MNSLLSTLNAPLQLSCLLPNNNTHCTQLSCYSPAIPSSKQERRTPFTLKAFAFTLFYLHLHVNSRWEDAFYLVTMWIKIVPKTNLDYQLVYCIQFKLTLVSRNLSPTRNIPFYSTIALFLAITKPKQLWMLLALLRWLILMKSFLQTGHNFNEENSLGAW